VRPVRSLQTHCGTISYVIIMECLLRSSPFSACVNCPSGRTSSGSGGNCTVCPPGTYSNAATAFRCSTCLQNQQSYVASIVAFPKQCACLLLPHALHVAFFFVMCSTGTSCASCSAGKFSEPASTSCTDCPAGRSRDASAVFTACSGCGATNYANSTSGFLCIPCTGDTYAYVCKQRARTSSQLIILLLVLYRIW